MLHSQLSRRLCIAVAAAGLFAVAGCSSQQDQQAANQAPKAKVTPKAVSAKADTPEATPVSAKATGPLITVPKGTQLTAIVDHTLTSKRSHKGDTFAASLAAPVKIHGKTVLPKGTRITGKVANVNKSELKVALASVTIRGKSYDLETNSRRPSDKLQAKSGSAKSNKSSDRSTDKQKKDNSILSAKSQLTFKLAKPLSLPIKG